MFRLLMYIGLAFLVPGLAAVGFAVYEGPVSWGVDAVTFWGVPVSLFVFWIGLAHAGTLLSAIFLALNVSMDRRTALLAELSTLVCLIIAAIYPLIHLGVIGNFYMVAPLLDARGNFANVRSPLVWDFCCIAVYGLLSLLFFVLHLIGGAKPNMLDGIVKIRRSMAWLLFPLVLWVHTIVSLDFATTFVPEWRGAFFPAYFIAGAIFSGLAMVNLLLCVENYRVRLLEKLMLVGSWVLCALWLWNFLLKGDFCVSAFVFAGVLPQFLLVENVRESRILRSMVCFSILFGMLLERIFLVAPTPQVSALAGISDSSRWVDWGLIAFGVGCFIHLFFAVRRWLSKPIENDEILMGDVDEVKESEESASERNARAKYFPPLTTPEYRVLRLPVLFGILVSLLFCIWAVSSNADSNIQVSLISVVPVFFPIVVLVASVILCAKPLWYVFESKARWCFVGVCVLLAGLFGAFYAGGSSMPAASESRETRAEHAEDMNSYARTIMIWNSRCSACHGVDGKFNEKFIREFYPVPQKLTQQRLDSLGLDSLVKVVLKGRVNMNPYGDRLSEDDARALVRYMRSIAPIDSVVIEDSLATDSIPVEVVP